jgi:hypothetical protein
MNGPVKRDRLGTPQHVAAHLNVPNTTATEYDVWCQGLVGDTNFIPAVEAQ